MQSVLMKVLSCGGIAAMVLMLVILLKPQFQGFHRFIRRLSNVERAILAGFLLVFVVYGGTKPTPPVPPSEPVVTNTVTFVLGPNGERTGGGELVQRIAQGGDAVAPTVVGLNGYMFTGWDVAFTDVQADLTVTAQYDAPVQPEPPTPVYEGDFRADPEDVTIDEVKPTVFSDVTMTFDSAAMAVGDKVALYRTADDVLCGCGEVVEHGGAVQLTLSMQVKEGTVVRFEGWQASSRKAYAMRVTLGRVRDAETLSMPEPGSIVAGLSLSTASGTTPPVPPPEPDVAVLELGRYVEFDLVADLGVEIPSDVDYAAGDKVTVKVEGLAKGLKLAQDKTTGVWILSGVPTETVDFETQPMYARVTTTYKDKAKGDKGKVETLQPIELSITTPEPSVLTAGVLGQEYGPFDITNLWGEVSTSKEWSFKGWPAGIKYKDGKVSGTPTKAGEFPITATWKHKLADGKTTVSETFSAVLTVWGDDGATDFCYTNQAYGAAVNETIADAKSMSGLPTGLKFKNGLVSGTPTKPGVFAVTVTKTNNSKETFLWKVTEGENDGFLGTMNWPVADRAVTVMAGVIQTNWTCSLPVGAKVTASGLPSGLKLVQDKTTKAWTLAGTPTKAGNFVVTLKTVRNGVTVTERISIIVTANKWTGSWYGVQDGHDDADASLLAEVKVSANGTVKLVYTEASTNCNAKGAVQSAVRKTTVTVKNLDANGSTATLTLPKDKKDPLSQDRICVLDFEKGELRVDGTATMRLQETDADALWPEVLTVVLEETDGGETNAYGYVTATYNAKKGSFALAGKLWDGTAVKGTASALADGCISPVLVTDKAKNAVTVTLGSADGDLRVIVRENGRVLSIGKSGSIPWSGGFDAADLKSKKFNMMSGAKTLVVALPGVVGSAPRADRGGRGATALPSVLVLEIPAKSLSASVSAQGLVKFTLTDAGGWKWVCELLPVRRDGEGAVATQGDEIQFRGIATGTKKGEPTQVCPVWAE